MPEIYEPEQLSKVSGLPRVRRLVHHANNGWTFHLDFDGEAELPDGRVVVLRKRGIRIKASQQVGVKPRGARR